MSTRMKLTRRTALAGFAAVGGLATVARADMIFGTGRAHLAGASDAEIHDWLRSRIREDFAAGRTVKIEGWILGDTEGRLYALAAHA